MSNYDLVIIGGGIAGSSLAKVMAEQGARVLVLERERTFRDRNRGEGIHPWGVTEACELGLYDTLKAMSSHEARWWTIYSDSGEGFRRDLVKTTRHRHGALGFYHPEMQESLLRLAASCGAEVHRGATVTNIDTGRQRSVSVKIDEKEEHFQARLIIGADGRLSKVRRWGEFEISRDPKRLWIAGVLLKALQASNDSVHVFNPPTYGQAVSLLPSGNQRFRAYFATGRRNEHRRLSGSRDIADFMKYCIETGVPADWFEGVEIGGPLSTFEGASVWVQHPYKNGVVLIGDAAACTDPCWGCGLSMTLRDVRILYSQLKITDEWEVAANEYAAEHDRHFNALHTIEGWMTDVMYGLGPEADRIRQHALRQLANGVGPDIVGAGPDSPADEAARIRFLGA